MRCHPHFAGAAGRGATGAAAGSGATTASAGRGLGAGTAGSGAASAGIAAPSSVAGAGTIAAAGNLTPTAEYPQLIRDTPEGTALRAIAHDDSGAALATWVYREDLEDGVSDDAYMLTIPEPRPDWISIEVPGLLPPELYPR